MSEPTFILNLVCLVFWVGLAIDRYFLMGERWVKHMMERTRKERRCVVCKRPMIIVSDGP